MLSQYWDVFVSPDGSNLTETVLGRVREEILVLLVSSFVIKPPNGYNAGGVCFWVLFFKEMASFYNDWKTGRLEELVTMMMIPFVRRGGVEAEPPLEEGEEPVGREVVRGHLDGRTADSPVVGVAAVLPADVAHAKRQAVGTVVPFATG